jgi:toxin-antitoxin system PIN domain toxin
MTASGISLVDANVWLAIAVDGHVHHATATNWFNAQPDGACAFCRITQLALLRHLTNAKIMGEANVLSQIDAWHAFEALAADSRVLYLDEPHGLGVVFKSFTQRSVPGHKRWTDAYLAALAATLSLEVVTFDTGLTGYAGVSVKLLAP